MIHDSYYFSVLNLAWWIFWLVMVIVIARLPFDNLLDQIENHRHWRAFRKLEGKGGICYEEYKELKKIVEENTAH